MRKAFRTFVLGALALWGTPLFGAPRQATVYTVDGQKLNGAISETSFSIHTPYGTLDVPTDDITALYPGFATGDASRKRMAGLIDRLTTANKDASVRDLIAMGRIAVPQLQAAAASSDKKLANEAKAVLKKIWPTEAKVPSDGSGILCTKTMDLRGNLTFLSVRVEGSFGKKTLLKASIRLIQFGAAKAQPAMDPPDYPPAKGGNTPELELVMNDSSRLIGTADALNLDVTTDYGQLAVPLKDIISIRLGDPDEIVTRTMTLFGKLSTTTLEVKSKVGNFKVDRDKVQLVKAVLEEAGTAVAQEGPIKLDQWTDIFDGKGLTGWSEWGGGSRKVEGGTIHLSGDSGLTYQNMDDVKRVIIAAEVKINNLTGPGAGVKLTVRESPEGTYFIHFDGKNGALFLWDTKTKQSTTLKPFQVDLPAGKPCRIQFAVLDTMLIAYINENLAAEAKIDPAKALPSGKVSIGVWNCDANFHDVRVKTLR